MDNEYLKSLGSWFNSTVGFVTDTYYHLNETQQTAVIGVAVVSVLVFVYAWVKTRKPYGYKGVEEQGDVWNYEPTPPESETTQEQPQRKSIEPSMTEKPITKEDVLEWYRNPGTYEIRDRGDQSSGGRPIFSGKYGLFKRDDEDKKKSVDIEAWDGLSKSFWDIRRKGLKKFLPEIYNEIAYWEEHLNEYHTYMGMRFVFNLPYEEHDFWVRRK